MNKRIIIVHGWGGSPQRNWMPWAKEELRKLGYEVLVPVMPDTEHPKMESWVTYLTKEIGKPEETDILVGHSLGCITILRYLEILPENQKVGSAVLVAGFSSDDLDAPDLKNFFQTPINFVKIRPKVKQVIAICSDNDPYVSLKHGDIFKEELGAEVLTEKNQDHFTNGTLPSLIKVIKNRF